MSEETPKEHGEETGASDVHAVEEPLSPVSIAKGEETSNEIEESKATEIPATHESIESSSFGTGEDTPTTGDEEDGTLEVHTDEKPIEPATLITDAEIEESKAPEASSTEESIKPSFIQLAADPPQKEEEETGSSELHTIEEPLEPTLITKGDESAKEIEEPNASEIPIAEESVKPDVTEDVEEQIKEPKETSETISEETGAPATASEEGFVEVLLKTLLSRSLLQPRRLSTNLIIPLRLRTYLCLRDQSSRPRLQSSKIRRNKLSLSKIRIQRRRTMTQRSRTKFYPHPPPR
jgi:hypothetical protein